MLVSVSNNEDCAHNFPTQLSQIMNYHSNNYLRDNSPSFNLTLNVHKDSDFYLLEHK